MYRCERCGNTARFVIDFMDRRFGTVEADWIGDEDDWDADWSKSVEEDGDVQMGPAPSACAVCQSPRIEEIDADDERDDPKIVGEEIEKKEVAEHAEGKANSIA